MNKSILIIEFNRKLIAQEKLVIEKDKEIVISMEKEMEQLKIDVKNIQILPIN